MQSTQTLRRRRGANTCPEGDELSSGDDFDTEKKVHSYPSAPEHVVPPYSSSHESITLVDCPIAIGLFIVACAVRFVSLSAIDKVIFDEVHFAKFTSWVLTGKFFFDVHPVFGKWLIALLASILGFDPSKDSFEAAGAPLSSPSQAFAGRAPAALLGSLTVPVFYFVCRKLRLSKGASFLGAAFILFDNMHVIQSRLIMVDSVLVFFTCLAMLFALAMWEANRDLLLKTSDRSHNNVPLVAALIVVTGIFSGLAVSVRWTAFATPMLILIVSAFGVPPFCVTPMTWLEVAVLFASMFSAYYGSFAVFLLSLSQSGTGDAFMSQEFQACLEGSSIANAALERGSGCEMSLWARFVELNYKIFFYSKGIRGSDTWGSTWFQWIFNWRGALYYRETKNITVGSSVQRLESLIYVLMNPAMVVFVDVLMCTFIGYLFYVIRYRKKFPLDQLTKEHLQRGCVLLCAWMGSMLPTMVVYRSGPVYQYLPGLFFAQALAALSFNMVPLQRTDRIAFVGLFCIVLMISFVYWSPWVYGTFLTITEHASRRWMPRWN